MIGRAIIDGARGFRSATLADPPDWLIDWAGGRRSVAGPQVDEVSAIRHPAVKACVRAVSEDIGKVPCIVYERTDNQGSRRRAPEDGYAPSLGLQPNPEMTAMEYWETMTAYLMLWGRATAYVNRRRNGTVELWPLPPNRVEAVRERLPVNGPDKYTPGGLIGVNVTLDNSEKRFIALKDLVRVGSMGYDSATPIARHRETIGLGLAGEEFGARFFGQGGTLGGFVQMPEDATSAEADKVEARFRAKHEGLERSHLIGVLTGGASWQDVGMPLKDAQYIDGREFGIEEVCRIFRVPPHKVQHLKRATFSNIEEQSIEYVVDTISSYCTRHEQAHRIALYGTKQYGAVGERWPEFLLDGLLRGDTESRYRAYAVAVVNGWMSRSEIRERENLPHDPLLDDFLVPLNMWIAGQPPPSAAPSDNGASTQQNALRIAEMITRNGHSANGDTSVDPSTVTP